MAGDIRPYGKRRYRSRRQEVAPFLGGERGVERFEVRQTVTYPGYEVPRPPSRAQHAAVMNFYLEACETPYQASTMLSARDYALEVARDLPFCQSARWLLAVGVAAFILGDREARALVRSLAIASRSELLPTIRRRGAHARCYGRVVRFAECMVDDMRGEGSELFG